MMIKVSKAYSSIPKCSRVWQSASGLPVALDTFGQCQYLHKEAQQLLATGGTASDKWHMRPRVSQVTGKSKSQPGEHTERRFPCALNCCGNPVV